MIYALMISIIYAATVAAEPSKICDLANYSKTSEHNTIDECIKISITNGNLEDFKIASAILRNKIFDSDFKIRDLNNISEISRVKVKQIADYRIYEAFLNLSFKNKNNIDSFNDLAEFYSSQDVCVEDYQWNKIIKDKINHLNAFCQLDKALKLASHSNNIQTSKGSSLSADIASKILEKDKTNDLESYLLLIRRVSVCVKENQTLSKNDFLTNCTEKMISNWRTVRMNFFEKKNKAFLPALAVEFSWVKYYNMYELERKNSSDFDKKMAMVIYVLPTVTYLEKNLNQAILLSQWHDGEIDISGGNFNEIGVPNSFNFDEIETEILIRKKEKVPIKKTM